MQLDVSLINSKSPYQVEQLDDLSFRFTTKNGLHYLVGFTCDVMFLHDGAYQFYIIEEQQQHGPGDQAILKTIIAVIEEFFRSEANVMLYICDTTDRKQSVRNRLFQYWFRQYAQSDLYVLSTEHIVVDQVSYFAGLLLSKQHPHFGEIISAFHQFALDLEDKWS